MSAIVEIENLTKDYEVGFWRKRPYRALDRLTLRFGPMCRIIITARRGAQDYVCGVKLRSRICDGYARLSNCFKVRATCGSPISTA